jgi:hypothetical protein
MAKNNNEQVNAAKRACTTKRAMKLFIPKEENTSATKRGYTGIFAAVGLGMAVKW